MVDGKQMLGLLCIFYRNVSVVESLARAFPVVVGSTRFPVPQEKKYLVYRGQSLRALLSYFLKAALLHE